ncbi:hypothetical protein ASG43_13900 [Aureimonas sp. Leaf454]|uniref:putative bifunctional diguanylate cyclase/phosphodiesterase n=1 Tax=Aureimonas sp. Leaf454 TaxID=1736381 RepID=UPI0006F5C8CB|nr:bifunctional diguanylate cyclase/phosphodiesterase [Aureimonas sp. Leaf454]KQT44436.1 hypothetical protein ASG43_13900 [Aureimonas sp. Leaf454]
MFRLARSFKLLLALLTGAFAVLAIWASFLIVKSQKQIVTTPRYNYSFDIAQASSEMLRLQVALASRLVPQTGATDDDVALRRDILQSRIKGLLDKMLIGYGPSVAASRQTFEDINVAVETIGAMFEDLDRPEVVGKAIAILKPLNRQLVRLASISHVEGSDAHTREQGHLSDAFTALSAIIVAMILSGISLLCAVFVQSEKAKRTALRDDLTGVSNRLAFRNQLRSKKPYQSQAVVLLDVDHFKNINDTLGHAAGDLLLIAMTGRLVDAAGEAAMLARLGGDEFGILFVGEAAGSEAQSCAEAILGSLRAPLFVDGHSLSVSASMGIAVDERSEWRDETPLMKSADLALYAAKAAGRGCARLFAPEMENGLIRRQRILNGLKMAIARNEFSLAFQPIVSLETRRLEGFEALLRWRHPSFGPVSPAEFIPVAEDSGLIVEIGRWVVEEACRTAAAWPERISISINVSGRQFADPRLCGCIEDALLRHGISAGRLNVELTESILVEQDEDVLAILMRLRKLGVAISLDDFGTGYASLGYLRRFAFDKLKIDQSFVRDSPSDLSSLAIIRAICDLALALGLKIVAEGIETQEQLDQMIAAGCHDGQGYHFDRPLSAEAASERVARDGVVALSAMPAAAMRCPVEQVRQIA